MKFVNVKGFLFFHFIILSFCRLSAGNLETEDPHGRSYDVRDRVERTGPKVANEKFRLIRLNVFRKILNLNNLYKSKLLDSETSSVADAKCRASKGSDNTLQEFNQRITKEQMRSRLADASSKFQSEVQSGVLISAYQTLEEFIDYMNSSMGNGNMDDRESKNILNNAMEFTIEAEKLLDSMNP